MARKAKDPEFVPISVRMSIDGLEHLDTLAGIAGVSRAEYLRMLVAHEWDAYNGNPQLKAIIEQMSALSKQMKQLSESVPAVIQS